MTREEIRKACGDGTGYAKLLAEDKKGRRRVMLFESADVLRWLDKLDGINPRMNDANDFDS